MKARAVRGRLPAPAAVLSPWRVRLDLPLYRNGYALVASSGVTSVLGLAYWLLAARLYSPAAVGVGAALIAAMTLLASIAQLNLKGVLNRFLPSAGSHSARLVISSYALALALAGLASSVFIIGLGLWSPELGFLAERPELAVSFVVATMAWTIFVLQDSVLAGIRQAVWAPAENLVFSLGKLILLVALVGATPTLGAFVSWNVPVIALIVPFNLIILWRLIPAHVRATGGGQPISLRSVAGYLAPDAAAYAIWATTIGVLPLVVLHVAGAEANAHFFVAWAIAYSLYLVSSGMCQSLLAEASLDPALLEEHARRTIKETAALVVLPAFAVAAFAPTLLGLLGSGYSSGGGTLLRLLALSAVPYVVVSVHVTVARVERRMRTVISTYATLCGLALALALPLLGAIGIEGIGIAWLTAQTAVAAGLTLRRARPRGAATVTAALSRALVIARRALAGARRPATERALRPVLRALERRHGGGTRWELRRELPSLGEVSVIAAGPANDKPAVLVKWARGDHGGGALRRELLCLLSLRQIRGLNRFRRLTPRPLASGLAAGKKFVATAALPGRPADRLLDEDLPAAQLEEMAVRAMRPLYGVTAAFTRVDALLLAGWVGEPLAVLRGAVGGRHAGASALEALDRIEGELHRSLARRELVTGFVHGDLWAGNLLVDEAGRISGIVDWESARPRFLPGVDRVHLKATTRALTSKRELGDVVAEMLSDDLPPGPARAGDVDDRTLLLLAWLHHMSSNLTKAARYRRNRHWWRRNVDPVLAAVLGAPRRTAAACALASPLAPATAALAVGLALWAGSLTAIDPRAMSDIGLVSALPLSFFAALLTLTAAFTLLVHLRPDRSLPLAAALVALIAVLHATPSIAYGTLRYSWAWKHVGIVDYIERHGAVAPGIDYGAVYHNWPGFFALDTLLTEIAGLGDALGHAIWGPFFFNLLNLGALLFLLSGLTRDRRVVWVGCWLFFVASWVGQDYFSPQAFAFFLYLVLLGVVTRWLRDASRSWALLIAVLLVAAIVVSHPLTAVMTVLALAGLVLCRACAVPALPLIALTLAAGWNLTFALPYVGQEAGSVIASIRLPWTTTEESLSATRSLSDGQVLVALTARGLVVAIAALAALGAYRLHRARRLDGAAPALVLAPLALFAAGDYEGEVLFRVYLFALPFLAYLSAQAFAGGRTRRSALTFAATATLMLGAFLVVYYGKERQYYFTPAEVAASRYVSTHAPAGSLLIEGTRNYPVQFKNYERFDYVTLSREPSESHERFASRPVEVMSDWMSDPDHRGAYLIITRSQKAEVEQLGVLPRGSLDQIERALLASPRFKALVRNRDATVFTLAEGSKR